MLDAIAQEAILQKDYLKGAAVSSIYFGGGTPSVLTADEINRLIETLRGLHVVEADAEITLEANPDDLSREYLLALRQTPINRLSIGVQSFRDQDLLYMNRAHDGADALRAIQEAQNIGFENITIDLIYGTPGMNDEAWMANLATAFALNIPHLSSYALTMEPKTALESSIRKGKVAPLDDGQASRQFELLMAATEAAGFEHYEISNFCRPPHYAKHNSNYWRGVSYLGLGPSAHSFDGASRQWNVANNSAYLKSLSENKLPFEKETLSAQDQYNEYLLTGLRTRWGVEEQKIKAFGEPFWGHFQTVSNNFMKEGLIVFENGAYTISRQGKFLADGIVRELFY